MGPRPGGHDCLENLFVKDAGTESIKKVIGKDNSLCSFTFRLRNSELPWRKFLLNIRRTSKQVLSQSSQNLLKRITRLRAAAALHIHIPLAPKIGTEAKHCLSHDPRPAENTGKTYQTRLVETKPSMVIWTFGERRQPQHSTHREREGKRRNSIANGQTVFWAGTRKKRRSSIPLRHCEPSHPI